MANLPQELKFNIFSGLPVKILCICKCVCKEWLNIVTDCYFFKLHLKQPKKYRQLLLLDQSFDHDDDENIYRRQVARFFTTSMKGELQLELRDLSVVTFYVIPSGHGLVCSVDRGNFYAFNPSMKKVLKLPKAQPSTFGGVDAGFGYIPSTNEYKLVHLYNQNEDDLAYNIKCEVITISDGGTVSSNSWKQIEKSAL